ncbi:MAG: hypothetical protein JNK21_13710 [Rhodospirillaceae bacterium]|nr:hypothetical protein [Rhodospirillaceae bacterium]
MMSADNTGANAPKKPIKAKALPKGSSGASRAKSGPAGVVRATRPPMARPPARGGR